MSIWDDPKNAKLVAFTQKQIEADNSLTDFLINTRKERYPNIDDFSNVLGFSTEYIEKIEANPHWGTIYFLGCYALALGFRFEYQMFEMDQVDSETEA